MIKEINSLSDLFLNKLYSTVTDDLIKAGPNTEGSTAAMVK